MSTSAQALAKSVKSGETLRVENLFEVKGRVALVTGGGTGLGLITANALADNGVRVYITGRRPEPLKAAARSKGENGGEIIPIVGDASDREGIRKVRDEISKKEKFLDILINNHGVSLPHADINACEQTPEGLSEEMFENEDFPVWEQMYRINTASYHFTTFAFLPLLAAAKSVGCRSEPGNIINISSMSGITVTSQRGQFNYNASKAATLSLTKMQATEFARRNFGIRVNCVAPGYFPSGMTVIEPENNTGSDAHFQEFRTKWAIPFGRPGNAVDYAQCIISLATNQYITGSETVIDGGWLLESAF
ncbi:hypothetical protein BD324DRAFT_633919 [Kockovaella imperatae]|uniref:Short-chain dehydrogenase n=1 Tax=Kockovaella imperatae TaxID=4999 RepID=A0A1Y1UAP1_9TREE|nr:hypothetical protein BD324DRAFT_633919 [Kockovaella imperatae]ORX35108.1 hypothetical protein BD324DRAFT_633919 [Kockovaella imperatae]